MWVSSKALAQVLEERGRVISDAHVIPWWHGNVTEASEGLAVRGVNPEKNGGGRSPALWSHRSNYQRQDNPRPDDPTRTGMNLFVQAVAGACPRMSSPCEEPSAPHTHRKNRVPLVLRRSSRSTGSPWFAECETTAPTNGATASTRGLGGVLPFAVSSVFGYTERVAHNE